MPESNATSERQPRALSASATRLVFDPARLDFNDTSRLPEPDHLVGQELAIDAIDFALGIDSGDFHVFAAGPPGTGRATLVRAMATRAARRRPVPPDLCCIYNFRDSERPQMVALPAGSGRLFAAEMSRLRDFVRKAVPAALTSREYRARHQVIVEEAVDARREHFAVLEQAAAKVGIRVEDNPANIQLLPLLEDGTEMSEEEYDALSDADRKAIEEKERGLRDVILEYLDHAKTIQDAAEEQIEKLDRLTVERLLDPKVAHIREAMRFAEIHAWLDDVADDIVRNVDDFMPSEDGEGFAEALRGARSPSERYDVNLVVDNSDAEGAPVIVELNPTYSNLVGKVERRLSFGVVETNHTLVRAGALHRANGGILVLDAGELLSHPFAYPALKRALREGACTIEDPDDGGGGMVTVTLKPEPVTIRVQLVLLGTLDDYIVLREYDSEFAKLVKVRADFEDSTPLTDEAAGGFARLIASICRDRALRHFRPDGVAAAIELASRAAGRQDELTLRIEAIRSIVVEADHWARRDGAKYVERRHVVRCDEEAQRRSSLFLRRTLREFKRKNLLITVEGSRVGQVNGLAVLGVGDILFGMPARITAKTFVGETGVVNIERETELSGQIHSKAVLILNGYLGSMYAQNRALALAASLTFEQNYSPIEGDSASVAELVALLSSLSGLPVRQDLAITGSMSQHGEVQPIGGVNEKVEGFFRVCAAEGLTGGQGAIIPTQNVANLNLDREVVEAIEAGRFHVFAVHSADEALSLLLGAEAGERGADGRFPAESIHGRVETRLADMADAVQRGNGQRGGA